MEKWQINSIIAIICSFLCNLFGGWDALLQTLIIICITDYSTGILAAMYQGKLSSKIGYRGIIKKICMFAVVALSCIIAEYLKSDLIRTVTITFYISNEAISILENVSRTGVKYPRMLKSILKELCDKGDRKNGKI